MKKILLTLAVIPAATLAVEASAQTYNPYGNMNANAYGNAYADPGIQNRIAQLEMRLNAGINAGVISRNEHNMLRRQIANLQQLQMQYGANGLTQSERRTLRQRIRTVRNQLRSAYGRSYAWNDSNWDNYNVNYGANQGYGYNQGSGYGANYGANVRYDQYGRPVDQYGRPIANNGITYDQYGRPVANGGYYGQGGPYVPAPQSNGIGNVLGGVLGSMVGGGGGMLGGLLGGRSLGVGDMITSAIANALGRGSSYGSQYQDRSNVYFRSDGQQVYEIDARTNQVIRIHPIR